MALTKVKSGVTAADIFKVINSATALGAAPAITDLSVLYDVSASTERKITFQELLNVAGGLTALTAIAADDTLLIYDLSATATKSITPAEFFEAINLFTAETVPAADDMLAIYDTSTSAIKKIPVATLTPFTKEFTSTEQTITTGGSLTLPHSLGAEPKLIQCFLKCLTTQHSYAVDQVVAIGMPDHTTGRGIAFTFDSTNLNGRFGNAANAFAVLNRATGALSVITNSSWSLIVKAWA